MPFRRARRLLALGLLGLTSAGLTATAVAPPASAAAKTVYLATDWNNGTVPWDKSRTKESADFVLFWGDKSGTDPTKASGEARFDPDSILAQLEKLYDFYVNKMKFVSESGQLGKYKINVIVTRTWSNAPGLDAWASGGSADGQVGVINVAPGAAAPGSWGLAHELGHVMQNYTFMGRSGYGLTDPSAGTFWEASAEYMAMQVYPDTAAGDLTRFLRTENLAYSSSRHHYGAWMLIQYLVDKHGGIETFNRIWNEARAGEHPLETYRRIAGLTQAQLDAQLGEYAQHQVTWDYSNRAHVLPFINQLYPFVTAYNGVQVDAVNQAAGHYAIPDALAPGDFGYNKIHLVSATDGGLIRLHFKGHPNAAAQSGWTYGFVALKNGTPRYSPVSSAPDGEVTFQTQPGEKDVYLVVAGTPGTVHHYEWFRQGFNAQYRYPYEFRVSGATPDGYQPGYVKPAAPGGGHWHSNGGGWVGPGADVAASAYVGPRAAVYSNATVSANARIEGLSWVNSGATVSGNAVVKDSALVQGGANLGGSVVVGGDAEPMTACSSGTYLGFDPDQRCDGRKDTDSNPGYARFTDTELALGGAPGTPAPTASTSPAPSSGTVAPSASPTTPTTAKAGCSATYQISARWSGGFLGEVYVRADGAALHGWRVSWTAGSGQRILQSWGAAVTISGSTVQAGNAPWNATVPAGTSVKLGFVASGTATAPGPAVTCTAG